MIKAIWNGRVIAESGRTEIVEGNHYFPVETLHNEFFRSSEKHTVCPGKAVRAIIYYTLEIDGKSNPDAA